MKGLRQNVAENSRMGSALLASILVHFVVLFAVSFHLTVPQTRRVSPSDFSDPLRARIIAAIRDADREEPAAPKEVPVADPAPQERPGAVVSRPVPGQEAPAAAPKPQQIPPQPKQDKGSGQLVQPFGIRLRERLYVGPYPPQFSEANPLLKGQGFVRDIDLDERPRPIMLNIPQYPPSALAAKTAGSVTIAFFLDEKGEVVHASPVDATEEFQPFGLELAQALQQSTFTPGKINGKPVKSITFQILRFNPQGWPEQQTAQPPIGAETN